MAERIDAHHHLWCYDREEFGWIGEGMGVLARDFLLKDLEPELASSGIQGGVVVQARQSLEETDWLLDLAKNSEVIKGVVGWAPIAGPEFPAQIERLRQFNKLKGLRHLIQDEPDYTFMLRPEFNAGIARMGLSGLVYDILIFEKHLPAAIAFVDRHPHQVFVLDHMAKPRIRHRELEPWRTNIRELAKRENVYCKLSGMVTEANWSAWLPGDLKPYLDVVLQAFGPKRLMAGSDWPVCLLATTYEGWFSVVNEFVRQLLAPEQDLILGGVANVVYSLNPSA